MCLDRQHGATYPPSTFFQVIFGFQTPPDSGEKLTLCITILMSLTFFMNMVSAMQPPSSNTPLIGTYFSCIMVMVACSVVCTVYILNFHERTVDTHEVGTSGQRE